MEIGSFFQRTETVKFAYPGVTDEVEVTIDKQRFMAFVLGQNVPTEQMVQSLAEAITDWNLEDDGTKLTPSPELLMSLPGQFIQEMCTAITTKLLAPPSEDWPETLA